jgi:hypothetical protein
MANTDQKLKISELDFAEIKNNLKIFLRDQAEFTDFDFEASGMSTLLDILAYNTHYMAFYNNMVANEMFMDTAVFRDSIVSHAKMLGYTPVSSKAARALVDVQLTKAAGDNRTAVTMPKFTKFQCAPVDSITYTFVSLEAKVGEYDPTCGRFCFHDVYLYQGQPFTYTFTHNASTNTTQSFELPDAGVDLATLDVIVQESSTSLASQKYTLATDATTVSSNANVFFTDEVREGRYRIYFGDGVIGKSLTDGNIVIVNYIKTEGAAANKANAFSLLESVAGITDHVIYPISPAAGGASPEGIDKIRFAAPKAFVSNNRGVTKNDLIALINSRYPYFEAVNVWGGEENDPPVYGKVFVAAKPELGYSITESEKTTVINDIIKPVSVVTVTPEFVDVDYNYLNVNASVYYDPTKTVRSVGSIKTLVRNAIIAYKTTELDQFNSRFKLSRMLRRIDDSEVSISYSDAEITIQKRLLPTLNTIRNYTLNFGTQLAREDTRYKIFSAPGYTQFDDNDVLRTCFLEETPGSSSGIEGISVTAAPGVYEEIPVIEIIGDGVGATARPVIVNGKLKSVVVDNPGIDYTNANAYLYYNGELDTTVKLSVAVQNRYGILRSYFFDNNNIKRTLNVNAGSIDYELGKITLNNFNPVDIEDVSKILKITARPYSNNFESARQRIITIDDEDSVSINITVNSVE